MSDKEDVTRCIIVQASSDFFNDSLLRGIC